MRWVGFFRLHLLWKIGGEFRGRFSIFFFYNFYCGKIIADQLSDYKNVFFFFYN